MPQYLVAIHHPDDYDPAVSEDDATQRDIAALNTEMKAAGIVVFVGGLQRTNTAVSVRVKPDGQMLVTDGPYLETKEHIGGFWVLDVARLDAALAWGRRAAIACRAPVEIRPFY
ncbi:MAG: YciI family protein [Devosia sp.]